MDSKVKLKTNFSRIHYKSFSCARDVEKNSAERRTPQTKPFETET